MPGDRFELEALGENLSATYSYHIDSAKNAFNFFVKDAGPLNCYYSSDRRFNSSAKSDSSGYSVKINVSVPPTLHYIFNCILRIDSFMINIGRTDYGDSARGQLNSVPMSLPEGEDIEFLVRNIPSISRPIDEKRAEAAYVLSYLATNFIVYHEVAHIILGHVDYMKEMNMGNLVSLVNFPDKPAKSLDLELRQVWEIEADILAIEFLLADTLSDDLRSLIDDAFDESVSIEQAVGFMVVAITAVFLIEHQHQTDYGFSTHPSPDIRLCAVVSELSARMKSVYSSHISSESYFEEYIDKVVSEMLEAWAELGLKGADIINYDSPEETLKKVIDFDNRRKEQCSLYLSYAFAYPFSQ